MAIPKKRTRPIEVDGHAYRWMESVTMRPDGRCRIGLTIESKAGGRRRILTQCVSNVDSSGDRDKITTPKNVAAVVRFAVSQGWNPRTATADFRFDDFDCVAGPMDNPLYNGEPVLSDE